MDGLLGAFGLMVCDEEDPAALVFRVSDRLRSCHADPLLVWRRVRFP